MGVQKIGSCVCLILVFYVSSNCGALEPVKQSNTNTIRGDTESDATKHDDTLYNLDISHPSIGQPIESTKDKVEEAKFVQIEVAEVANPKRYALTFEVYLSTNEHRENLSRQLQSLPAGQPWKVHCAHAR